MPFVRVCLHGDSTKNTGLFAGAFTWIVEVLVADLIERSTAEEPLEAHDLLRNDPPGVSFIFEAYSMHFRFGDGRGDDLIVRYLEQRGAPADCTIEKPFRHCVRVNRFTYEQAHAAFSRALRWRPIITDEVAAMAARLGIGPCTLGVHCRGLDKEGCEAAPVSAALVAACVENMLRRPENAHVDSVLLAMDDLRFLDQLQKTVEACGRRVIVLPDPSLRAGNLSAAIHKRHNVDADLRARWAIMTTLLLAECGTLLKTASALSAWAKIMRPSLPVWRINAYFWGWMPDNGIPLYRADGDPALQTALDHAQAAENKGYNFWVRSCR